VLAPGDVIENQDDQYAKDKQSQALI